MKTWLPMIALCLAAACRGSAPIAGGGPAQGIAAVLIGGRILLPGGEAPSGEITINLEDESAQGEIYRLRVLPRQARLYQVEPGSYRLSPTRSLFGAPEATLEVRVAGRSFRAPFPRELLRESSVSVKPKRIVALGVLEARLSGSPPGEATSLSVSLDNGIEARRRLVETAIHNMMDPSVPSAERERAISWTKALDQSLQDLLTESQRAPLYKLSP